MLEEAKLTVAPTAGGKLTWWPTRGNKAAPRIRSA